MMKVKVNRPYRVERNYCGGLEPQQVFCYLLLFGNVTVIRISFSHRVVFTLFFSFRCCVSMFIRVHGGPTSLSAQELPKSGRSNLLLALFGRRRALWIDFFLIDQLHNLEKLVPRDHTTAQAGLGEKLHTPNRPLFMFVEF